MNSTVLKLKRRINVDSTLQLRLKAAPFTTTVLLYAVNQLEATPVQEGYSPEKMGDNISNRKER